MIKLLRPECPAELTEELVLKLTERFKETGEAVWNLNFLKKALLNITINKCAYCECFILNESKYLEIDHFACKHLYPDEVVKWANLLPSCKRCNGKKGDHDVKRHPILDPTKDDPRYHFNFHFYRFQPKTTIAKDTIEVFGLNDSKRAVKSRYDIGETISISLETALERLNRYLEHKNTIRKNKIVSTMDALLTECLPSSCYAATAASILHNHLDYAILRSSMQNESIWQADLEALHQQSYDLAFF